MTPALRARERYLDLLRKTQWLSPAALDEYTSPLLDRLLRHAATQAPFYHDRLAPLFHGGDPATAPIDYARWHDVPIVRRTHLLDYGDTLRAETTPPETGGKMMMKSSGSTGRPVETWRSEVAMIAGNLNFDRAWEAWGVDIGAPFAIIATDPTGSSAAPNGSQRPMWSPAAQGNKMSVLAIGTPIEEQLEWLERIRPTNLMTYPFLLDEIARLAMRKGSDLRLDSFISCGETLAPASRARIQQAFGCRVIVDIYSAREIGPIAFACPESTAYHACSETVMVELVDDDGMAVAPGSWGRVVVTGLYSYAMPLIRYDVGDYALKSRFACTCGRGLPAIDAIGGRTRSLFVMPDGSTKRFHPPILTEMANYLSYREIQLVQETVDRVEIRYVPMDADFEPDLAALTQILRGEFHSGIEVTLRAQERIERGPGMKFELLMSRVAT
jgi:phenylacetate-CoA ligase